MTGRIRPWRRSVAGAAAAAVIGLGSLPAAASAADPPVPYILPGGTHSAVTADIDGDGAREVVRVTGDGASTELEAWDLEDGTWTLAFSAAAGDLPGPEVPTDGGMPPVLVRTAADGGDRVLVVSTGYDPETGMHACCLTVHELIGQSSLSLRRMESPELSTESVAAVDLDGDGNDELVVWAIAWDEDGGATTTKIEVLRRDDGAWTSIAAWEEEGPWWVTGLVETDGAPGTEVIARLESGDLNRVTWVDGAIAVDRARVTLDRETVWIAGSVDGTLIVASSRSVGLVRWPRGAEATVVATHSTVGYPRLGVLGRDSDALLILHEHLDSGAMTPVMEVLDLRLETVGEVSSTPASMALWDLTDEMARSGSGWGFTRSIWPYFGPVDGDVDGGQAPFAAGGTLISAVPGGSVEAQPTASLVGQPIGPAGPDDGWVAVSDSFLLATGPVVYLQGGFAFEPPRLTLVPLATLLAAGDRDPLVGVSLEGGVETGHADGVVTLLAAPSGVDIIVSAVPGTIAVSWDGRESQDHGSMDGPLRLSVPPPQRPRPDRTYSFERDLILIAPDGSASVHRWEGTFAPEQPDVTAWADVEPLSLEATVAGRAPHGSTVTVDGREVALNAFGAYRATVDAPPWPRSVIVVARDPFGGERRATVEVIGLVDYRGLPWVPIAGVATVLGGAALFMRTPRSRPEAQRRVLDDGRLEDLDGDVI